MRNYVEPSARNLLRKPLILGVPLFGLIALAFVVLVISVLFGTAVFGNLVALGVGVVGYVGLRIISKFAKQGWEEALFWWFEKRVKREDAHGTLTLVPSSIEISPPDTWDEAQLVAWKDVPLDQVLGIKPGERFTLVCEVDERGAKLSQVQVEGKFNLTGSVPWGEMSSGIYHGQESVYSLHLPPVATDPLWLYGVLSRIKSDIKVVLSIRGVDFYEIKKRVEASRRSNARTDSALSDIDSDVTFEEASTVLRGLSRGDETVVEISLVVISKETLDLDPSVFCLEKDGALAVAGVLGIRKRMHRSHFVRAVTACDLIPNVLDPFEVEGASILTTLRGKPLYFSPDDSRLEALHWLVVGATGSGKSFFTGLVLKRMIEAGTPMSVLFVDHNRSFRRLVRKFGNAYSEPQEIGELERDLLPTLAYLDAPGSMVGVELSDLRSDEKKAGIQKILGELESFLRARRSVHPVYVVLDECWNFMRDEPVLVQRAFREFRKLNGAAIAITQSLSDFLTDSSGQSIFQNAPIRILLRQGEDLGRYQGVLGLNTVELSRVRSLKQQKGTFSECLVKTPFLSRLGRLYPTELEHSILRTDNLREELIRETKSKVIGRSACASLS